MLEVTAQQTERKGLEGKTAANGAQQTQAKTAVNNKTTALSLSLGEIPLNQFNRHNRQARLGIGR
jgi:hypothetical protein